MAQINKPNEYFNTKLYTGNGSTQSITGVGFQPDWVWLKDRSASASHEIFDVVRGVTKTINSNTSNAEATQTDSLTAFDSDGFSLGSNGDINFNNSTYVGWNWKAGTTASGNTGGSGTYKTYSSSSNSTAGFSIVKYTGNGTAGHTIPHGCGSAPSMVIFKQLNATRGWGVYHKDLGVDKIIYLDDNIAPQTASPNTRFLNNTAPSSSVVTLGTWNEVNINDASYIAYCFSEKKGFSKFGSYTGNGSTDGTFVYTGFKPAFFMYKSSSGAQNWIIQDNKRANSFNEINADVRANLSDAETTNTSYNDVDFLSNGIKLREDNNDQNASGGSYIYMAFAENPLVGTNNIPATAR